MRNLLERNPSMEPHALDLEPTDHAILAAIGQHGALLSEIGDTLDLMEPVVAARLTSLEAAGVVESWPDGRYAFWRRITTPHKDRNGTPIRLGDRAFHIGEDDGRIHTGTIRMERVEWSEDDQKALGVPAVMEAVVLVYDEAPRCQDDREHAYVDQMEGEIEVGEPSAALRQVAAYAKEADEHIAHMRSAIAFAVENDSRFADLGFDGGVGWLLAWQEGDEAAIALLDRHLQAEAEATADGDGPDAP